MRERSKGVKFGTVAVRGGAVPGTAGYGVREFTSGGPGPKGAASSSRTVVAAEVSAAGPAVGSHGGKTAGPAVAKLLKIGDQ